MADMLDPPAAEPSPGTAPVAQPTIVEVMRSDEWFGQWFKGPSWDHWEAFLAGLFGLPMTPKQLASWQHFTNRQVAPTAQAGEAWMVVGRRGGKSRISALIGTYLACFRDYGPYLAPGEVATIPLLAADRKEARTLMRYTKAMVTSPQLAHRLARPPLTEVIELTGNIQIEIHTARYKAVRGYTVVAVLADEIAFWETNEESANPDEEVINAVQPGMASIPGAMLIGLSSPYARKGVLWEAHDKHFGKDGDPIIVWQGPSQVRLGTEHDATPVMNPALSRAFVEKQYQKDEAAAAAEYGANFRTDLEDYVSLEALKAVTVTGRLELSPVPGTEYRAFVDPSGGVSDSFTLAIAHLDKERGRVVLDCVREQRAPFKPATVVGEFVKVLKLYGIERVTGDRYGGKWPRERFSDQGISYQTAEMNKSDLYLDLLPRVNSGEVELLDIERLRTQLHSLKRRTARGGHDSVDHPANTHDDLANAVAGVLCSWERPSWQLLDMNSADDEAPKGKTPLDDQVRARLPQMFEEDSPETCGTCLNMGTRDGRPWCTARRFFVKPADPACHAYEEKG